MNRTLYFCMRCSACCRWPGDVVLRTGEVERIAGLLHLAPDEFIDRYTMLGHYQRGLTLTERPDGACIFLNEPNVCAIYPARPRQCRDFPHRWEFPAFRDHCRVLALRVTWTRLAPEESAVPVGRCYFPQTVAT